jgi:flagellar protein FlgJ
MNIPSLNISSALQGKIKASELPFDSIASNTKLSNADKISEASRQFEAVLLRQMLGEARKSMSGTAGGEGESSTTSIYNDMVNDQLAESISRSGAFGLARSLQSQLVMQTLPKSEHPPVPATIGIGKK